METILTATELRTNIYKLIDQINKTHKPITIRGKRNNAILVSETDWSSIQETLFLMSNPEIHRSIIEGMNTPLSDCSDTLEW